MAVTPLEAFELIGKLVHVEPWADTAEPRDDDWYAFDGYLIQLQGEMPDLLATVRNPTNLRVIDEIPISLISVIEETHGM